MLSIMIVSVVMLAALGTVGATHRLHRTGIDGPRAVLLAQDLMAEILLTPSFDEPFGVIDFGPEGAELATGRAAFDDIDDYHGWTRSPPEARDGSPLPDLEGWSRSVTVSFGNPADLGAESGSDGGIKIIKVTVSRAGQEKASLTMLRTESWRSVPE